MVSMLRALLFLAGTVSNDGYYKNKIRLAENIAFKGCLCLSPSLNSWVTISEILILQEDLNCIPTTLGW